MKSQHAAVVNTFVFVPLSQQSQPRVKLFNTKKMPKKPQDSSSTPPSTTSSVMASEKKLAKDQLSTTRPKNWFKILFSAYVTFTFLTIAFLLIHMAHNYLLYQSPVITQFDSRLKDLWREGRKASPLFTYKFNALPPAIVDPINNVVRIVNQYPFMRDNGIKVPVFPVNEYVTLAITVANIPYIALLIAFAYTMTSKLPVILGQIIEGNGKLDNATPREQQSRMTGFGSRALGAHQNAFEALIGFGIIVAVTLLRIGSNTDSRSLELAASLVKESIFFVIARTIFQVWYPLGLPALVRTIIWAFGWMSVLQLYINNVTY